MRYVEDFSDDRQKSWCIHCGLTISNDRSNRDHVPTRSLLSKEMRVRGSKYDGEVFPQVGWKYERDETDPDGYLPQVLICKQCNTSFSEDENYLLCVLHAVNSGSLYPDKMRFPEAAKVLKSNRHVVRLLKAREDGQLSLFGDPQPFIVYPDWDRIIRVIVKNARGHAYHELGEPLMEPPTSIGFLPMHAMSEVLRQKFESIGAVKGLWPEMGSRMLSQVINGSNLAGGWITVEEGRYRYALDWDGGVKVSTVIWEYLATEVIWNT